MLRISGDKTGQARLRRACPTEAAIRRLLRSMSVSARQSRALAGTEFTEERSAGSRALPGCSQTTGEGATFQ